MAGLFVNKRRESRLAARNIDASYYSSDDHETYEPEWEGPQQLQD